MQQLLSTLISSFLQVLVFSLPPFLFFLFRKDKTQNFFTYIGLIRPTRKSISIALGIALLFLLASIGLAFTNKEIKQMLLSEHSVAGQLHLLGLNPVSTIILLITALIKTSLSEEILFRGFIAKRAINRWGFGPGNLLQALLFGLIHLLLFWLIAKTPILPCVFIFTFSSLAAWLIGHNMIRNGNGSIIPGWISHGAGNALAYFMLAFVI